MKKLLFAGAMLASAFVFAEAPAKPTSPAPAVKLTPAQKDTIKSCYANATINDDGHPDRAAVKQCLEKNKIALPARQGWRDMKPEDREKLKQAFAECKTSQAANQDKKATHDAMKACMASKGIQLPLHGGHGRHHGGGDHPPAPM